MSQDETSPDETENEYQERLWPWEHHTPPSVRRPEPPGMIEMLITWWVIRFVLLAVLAVLVLIFTLILR